MPKISAVIITKNEAKNIRRCIESLKPVVDEILVIDAFSEDKTVEIAKSLGAKTIQKEWRGYSQNKNFGSEQTTYDWILSVDADEVLSDTLQKNIQQLKPNLNLATVYCINRLTNYCGRWIQHSNWHPDWNVRLFHKSTAKWKGDFVHEKLAYTPTVKVKKIDGLLYHYSYQTSADHWQRIERYAHLSAKQLQKEGKKATFIKLWLSPVARFIKTYFIKRGFLDGKSGWTIAIRNAYLVHRKYRLLQGFDN